MQHSLGCFCLLLGFYTSDSIICPSIDVRNSVESLENLRNCTVVEGNVQIVLIEKGADFESYTFPLREVTEYMLFYRVRGLRNLGKMFPYLEKIGGAVLYVDYALVVYEMFSLEEIGLSNLKVITRGSVYIRKNSKLCFANTIKWDNITQWEAVQNHYSMNRDAASCPRCPEHCQDNACWNTTLCQFQKEAPKCHPLCVGQCSTAGSRGCFTCRGYFDTDGNCVHKCPLNTYIYLNRRCVTRDECINMHLLANESNIIHEDRCQTSCPSGFEPDYEKGECRKCQGRCPKFCPGAKISNLGHAQKLRGCTHIKGGIEIDIKSETTRRDLEEGLGAIEEIEGYLHVQRSSLTDLNFFRELKVINGTNGINKTVFEDGKTLVVIDNENLQDLWDWNVKKNLTIANGNVYFHFNPKLCLNLIYKLLDVIGHEKNVSNLQIGKDSNGDKFLCETNKLFIKVTKITHDSIQLDLTYNGGPPGLRYVVYYAKDPSNNISEMFDDLDQCSDFGWRTEDSNELDVNAKGFQINLTNLDPYTYYVFYVTTYTINSLSARSEMHRERTLPGTPSAITGLRAIAKSSSEVQLRWDPPDRVNGELSEYIVTWYELNDDRAFVDQRNYCTHSLVADLGHDHSGTTTPPMQISKAKCCSSPQKNVDDIDILCNQFTIMPKGFPDNIKHQSCKDYFYSYIYNSPFKFNEVPNNTAPMFMKTNEIFPIKKLGRNKNLSSFQNQILNSDPLRKNKAVIRERHLPPESMSYDLKELKHFQNYFVSIKACRKLHKNESDARKSVINRCSKSEIITVRTKGIETFDAIKTYKAEYSNENGIIEVKWGPPENPNGLIVAFGIEYRDKELQNPELQKKCLTYAQYTNYSNRYFIDVLHPEKYEFRIRTITLFGEGPFTDFFGLQDKEKESNSKYFVVTFAVALILVILMVKVLPYLTLQSKDSLDDPILMVDVNPNYHYHPDHYEIDRDDIEFIDGIGIGSFGKVYKGRWTSKNLQCAIKTVSDNATEEDEREFLIEASFMKSMTKAYFIVQIFGVVSRGRPPLVLMELMEHGDLKTYLRNRRETNPITSAMMIKMALEIADGMAYMEANKFVHRDLAARNCMVNSEITVKVGDFGMTRDVYETEYYRKKTRGFLPIRWMAPESLKDGEYTSQSDIWSYGVVLWEIVTMAEQPYQGYSNDEVLRDVIAGKRLDIPNSSPLPLKSLMRTCWRTEPSMRTTFISLVGSLEYYHDEEFQRVAYYHSAEAKAAKESLWEYVEMKPLLDSAAGNYLTSTSFNLTSVDES